MTRLASLAALAFPVIPLPGQETGRAVGNDSPQQPAAPVKDVF